MASLQQNLVPKPMPERAAGPILLYDGDCALCVRSVRFVLRHEGARPRERPLRFAALSGETGESVRTLNPALYGIDSVVWCDGNDIRVRSDAVLTVLRYLGGWWRAVAAIGAIVPAGIRDRAYDAIARSRRRLFGTGCLIPSPSERDRMLP